MFDSHNQFSDTAPMDAIQNDYSKLSAERREDRDAQVMPEEFYGQDTLTRWEKAEDAAIHNRFGGGE